MPRVALTRADREAAAVEREVAQINGVISDALCLYQRRQNKRLVDISADLGVGQNAVGRWARNGIPGIRNLVALTRMLGLRVEGRTDKCCRFAPGYEVGNGAECFAGHGCV